MKKAPNMKETDQTIRKMDTRRNRNNARSKRKFQKTNHQYFQRTQRL